MQTGSKRCLATLGEGNSQACPKGQLFSHAQTLNSIPKLINSLFQGSLHDNKYFVDLLFGPFLVA